MIRFQVFSEQNIYLLIKILSVSIRILIPISAYIIVPVENGEQDIFLKAWTVGYLYLTLLSCGFHDALIRTKKNKLTNKIQNAFISITIHFFALFIFVYFYNLEHKFLYFIILLYNYSYSLVICSERILLYKNRKKQLTLYSLITTLLQLFLLLLCYQKLISMEVMLFYTSIMIVLLSLIVFNLHMEKIALSIRGFFLFYRGSLLLTVQVILFGIYGRLEQFIFAGVSSNEFADYFFSMRIMDVFFIFLSFQSQYNLISSFKDDNRLNVINYIKAPFVIFVMMSSILIFILLLCYYKSVSEFLLIKINIVEIALVCSPLIILKATNNYFVDLMKRDSRDKTGAVIISICIFIGVPLSILLVREYGVYGAVVSSYIKLIVFSLIAGASEKIKSKL
ncbi:hypothetical protein CWN88_08505 [Vibrio splendidus]|uniref:hypothetical protein n=1 Tax=Vibrio splendidus TaxID=29497 RepID=UPI000D364A4B|nr:hypothetical protein [Vibrio splendidus]PTP03435.1 hypothetical protein CWN88_08505 [Vibrio splendidus]